MRQGTQRKDEAVGRVWGRVCNKSSLGQEECDALTCLKQLWAEHGSG